MRIEATHGEDRVIIVDIKAGNIKDCKEVLIIYYNFTTGAIGCESGDEEIFNNFVVVE